MRYCLIPAAAMLLLASCSSGSAPAAGSAASAPGATTTPPAATPTTPATPVTPGSTAPGPATRTGCRGNAGASASDVFGSFGRNALTDLQFVSPRQGWVVGQRVILTTNDGGATWSAQDRGELNLLSVDFISSEVGWAVGLDTLLATTDGGRHWVALPEPCPVIRSVHFVSARIGFAVAGGGGPAADASLPPSTGGTIMMTSNGGISWQAQPAPADPQSVCFGNSKVGWLGAHGKLYLSIDGGRSWRLQARGPAGPGAPSAPGVMYVQCAGESAWALDVGPGAAMSQEPHIGYHASLARTEAIFAEQYFPHPGVAVTEQSPGSYAGPISAISSSMAVFIDGCPACGWGTAPWDLVTAGGATLIPKGKVGGINQAYGASFISPSVGWVVGAVRTARSTVQRIVHTADSGKSWQVQYSAG